MTLSQASSTKQLERACYALTHSLYETIPIDATLHPIGGAKLHPIRGADATVAALSHFILHGQNVAARIKCSEAFSELSWYELDSDHVVISPYAPQSRAVAMKLLKDRDVRLRIAAINALRRSSSAEGARALLYLSAHDGSRAVVLAALDNIIPGMLADVRINKDADRYDRVFRSEMRSKDDDIAVLALGDFAMLNGMAVIPVLERYAASPDPKIRKAAVQAYGNFMQWNNNIIFPILERHLADRDASVREEAMWQLGRLGDRHALPALKYLSRFAPTNGERSFAAYCMRLINTGS